MENNPSNRLQFSLVLKIFLMTRASWKSKIGFIFAAAGSAVGLANIWRFPYIVGKYGGAAFICVYLACLLLIGIPVFISEVLVGKSTQSNPQEAFAKLGKSRFWSAGGLFTIITGFLISSFYCIVAGWVLGYLVSAVLGQLSDFSSIEATKQYFTTLVSNPFWSVGFQLAFMLFSVLLLISGVRRGIEKGSEIMVPFLILILVFLVIKGVTLPGANEGLSFYLKPNWRLLTPTAFLFALGHAFFTLSLGQGTMVTYGSYLSKKESVIANCFPVAIIDTLVALLAGLVIFPIVFSAGLSPDAGEPLVFYTLPLVFSQLKGGYILGILFFLLLSLAAITSQISAMEPMIAYLIDKKKWKRSSAVIVVGAIGFLFGVPAAFSNSIDPRFTLLGKNFFDLISYIVLEIMVPIGGFLVVILVAWRWKLKNAFQHLIKEGHPFQMGSLVVKRYLWITIRYVTPILILIIFLQALLNS